MYTDRFGFLPRRLDIEWEDGTVRTLEDFDSTYQWARQEQDINGYLYPPIVQALRRQKGGYLERGSERSALLYHIPASHQLSAESIHQTAQAIRNGFGGFIIHFIGFLLGYRCQFEEWLIDGRLRIMPSTDASPHSPRQIEVCLNVASETWRGLSGDLRTVITNALYMQNRTPSYEFMWERFTVEYFVFDALFSVARKLHSIAGYKHRERIMAVANTFGIWHEEGLVERIVDLRNDLFHEVLWGGTVPGGAAPDDTYYVPLFLHNLNQRLGLAVLGFTGTYIASPWNSLGPCLFELDVFTDIS